MNDIRTAQHGLGPLESPRIGNEKNKKISPSFSSAHDLSAFFGSPSSHSNTISEEAKEVKSLRSLQNTIIKGNLYTNSLYDLLIHDEF